MSDQNDPADRPVKPLASRRRRTPRAGAEGAAAPPPAPAPPVPEARKMPAADEANKGRPPRGKVCPACGKYHDITHRSIGSTFDCKCGRELVVPPIREHGPTRPPDQTLRLRDLRRRRVWSVLGMLIAFPACIALLSATVFLMVSENRYIQGSCAALAAIGFLAAAVVATNEYRRTTSEIAAERVEDVD